MEFRTGRVPLLSADSWIARRCNPRPEQKVAHQVVGENEEIQRRCQLVTVRAIVLADRDFVRCAVGGEKSQANPTVMYRAFMGGLGPQQDTPPRPLPLDVSFRTLAPGREIQPSRIPTSGTAAAPLCRLSVIVLQQTTQSLLASNHPSAIRSWQTCSRKQECVVLALMVSFGVVMFAEVCQGGRNEDSPNKMSWERHALLAERTQRSA